VLVVNGPSSFNRTGQPKPRIETDLKRDVWMNSQETIGYGLADSTVLNV